MKFLRADRLYKNTRYEHRPIWKYVALFCNAGTIRDIIENTVIQDIQKGVINELNEVLENYGLHLKGAIKGSIILIVSFNSTGNKNKLMEAHQSGKLADDLRVLFERDKIKKLIVGGTVTITVTLIVDGK